jgi:RNA polymerase sigma factor, sigma-70 family
MPALRTMAFRLKERLPGSIDVNDLIGVGVEEMIKLSRKYDKDRNDSFWGYAKKRVYGSMLDFLRDLDVISRTDRTLVKAIDAVTNEYFNEHETEPDDEYVAKILNEDVENVKEARNISSVVSTLRIDDQMELMSDEDTLAMIEKEDLTEKIQAVLQELDERDQLVIQLYYYEELSLKEISEILRVSEGRVSQVHKRLMQKIRDRLEGR